MSCAERPTYDQRQGSESEEGGHDVDGTIGCPLLPSRSDIVSKGCGDLADLILAAAEFAHVRASSFDCSGIVFQGMGISGDRCREWRERRTNALGGNVAPVEKRRTAGVMTRLEAAASIAMFCAHKTCQSRS